MPEGNAKLMWTVVVVLLVAIGFIQHAADPAQLRLAPPPEKGKAGELMVQLPGQFIVASMTGFKEVIAGALWVRADHFFHTGQYAAIIPIVRLVTWLDPHNLDVYTTGAWHLDYNFVDQAQMSDKRYIPASIALLKEGIKHNPNVWDLYFELGWTHYNKKVQDYQKALDYMEQACKLQGFDPNTGKRATRPDYVDRMLAHQYEKVGRFKDAIAKWEEARTLVDKAKDPKTGKMVPDQSSLDVCDRNLGLLYLRLAWRYGDMDAYKKGIDIYKRLASAPNAPPDIAMALKDALPEYERRVAANNPPRDALKPLDTGFEVSFQKVQPKVFILKGKLNLVSAAEYKDLASESFTHWYRDNEKSSAETKKGWRDGCRVRWMICDYDYEMPELDSFSWNIDMTKTVVWDTIYVQGGTFSEKIELNHNPEFYPFKADKYKLIITVVPEQSDTPDYVQDRIGWKGEALVDKNYLDAKTHPGFRMLRKEIILDRKDVL